MDSNDTATSDNITKHDKYNSNNNLKPNAKDATTSESNEAWIRLTEPKQWSRLLYPNPVCFLCTPSEIINIQKEACDTDMSTSATDPMLSQHDKLIQQQKQRTKGDVSTNETTTKDNNFDNSFDDVEPVTTNPSPMTTALVDDDGSSFHYHDNVMIISWLTAINNEGKFIMSMNRHRYTANYFVQYQRRRRRGGVVKPLTIFVLAVPVRGMEQLIRNVGSVSGRLGTKFNSTSLHSSSSSSDNADCLANNNNMSKRQKRKLGFPNGIPGLYKISVGGTTVGNNFIPTSEPTNVSSHSTSIESVIQIDNRNNLNNPSLFAIDGTVAHMVCSVTNVAEPNNNSYDSTDTNSNIGGENHLLVTAQVIDAYVRTDYWDNKKNIFRPSSSSLPPFLTFFGAQEFGYVIS